MTWSTPERAQEFVVVRRGGADDARAGCLGDLHGGGTHATRRAVNEHGLAALDVAGFVQRAIRGLGRDGHARGLLEGHGLRLAREARDRDDGVLGVAAALTRETEHLVADLPAGDAFAQRVDGSGDIRARHHAEAPQRRLPVHGIHAGCTHLDEHFAGARPRHRPRLHRQPALTDFRRLHFFRRGLGSQAEHQCETRETQDGTHRDTPHICAGIEDRATDMRPVNRRKVHDPVTSARNPFQTGTESTP